MPKTRPAYAPEFRREAVQMLDEVDRHERTDAPTSAQLDELRQLRRENARLKQERDLLKRAAAFFAAENERRFRPDGPNQLWVADITYLRTGEGWLYLAAVQDTYSRAIVGWTITCASVFATLNNELDHRRSRPTRHELTGEIFKYIEAFYNRVRRHSTLGMLLPAGVRKQHSQRPRTQPRRFAAQGLTTSDHHQLEPESPTLSGEPGEDHIVFRKPVKRCGRVRVTRASGSGWLHPCAVSVWWRY